jgi:translation initiation factor 4G
LDDKATPAATASDSPSEEEEGAAPPSMSEADAKKKIEEDVKEFFAIRNLEEAEAYFTALPAEHHFRLIDKLVTVAVERKIDDAQLVADLFKHVTDKNLCSVLALEEGLTPTVEILSDIAIDVPKAFDLMAVMIKGTPLINDEEKKSNLVSKCMDDSDKLMALLS